MTPENGQVIFHADDLGLARAFNEGVREGHLNGLVTSTSIRSNGPAFDHAIESVIQEFPNLGVGLHLNIVEGRSQRASIGKNSHICDSTGAYTASFPSLLTAHISRRRSVFQEIEEDYRQQIESALSRGIKLDHLNSHQHSHAVPSIFEVVCKLANEYNIPCVRLPKERFYFAGSEDCRLTDWYPANLVKFISLNFLARANIRHARNHGVKTNDFFVGILYSGHENSETLKQGLKAIKKPTAGPLLIEVLVHPCRMIGGRNEDYYNRTVRDYVINAARADELKAVQDPELESLMQEGGWQITCFSCASNGSIGEHASHRRRDGLSEKRGSPTTESIVVDQNILSGTRSAVVGKKLRTFVIIDETPFYHPEYLRRLITECDDTEICGVAVVTLPKGGVLQSYLIKRWRLLGLREMFKLGIKSLGLRLSGGLPRAFRGRHFGSVRAVAKHFNIPHIPVSKVNNAEFLEYVRAFEPDVVLSSNSLIFGQRLIDLPKVACINRHSALLPTGGGILPVFRAVQQGSKFTGASVHLVTKEIDGGAVLSRKWVPIFPGDTLSRLYSLCFAASYEATAEALQKLRYSDDPEFLSDDGLEASYFSYPDDADWREFRKQGGRFI
jgi:predicted glycoside hydrolase/deacetylase ChbG (UPF0249 family)/folate-dependent phosphoribosylglycinamide formyltransferase PurN